MDRTVRVGLCLSGGGYRAVLFHCGALLRLSHGGWLSRLAVISGVSGGALVAARLGLRWLSVRRKTGALQAQVIAPLQALCRRSIDTSAVAVGLLPLVTAADYLEGQYRDLFGRATLQDLPADGPQVLLNATNVQTGQRWSFSRAQMGDRLVGRWQFPKVALARAVAASTAFPPILSPCPLYPHRAPDEAYEFGQPPYTTDVELTDGGVYDNLGLEAALEHCDAVLVSDAGLELPIRSDPADDWVLHTRRVVDLIQAQVGSLRKRMAEHRRRTNAWWSLADRPKTALASRFRSDWRRYTDVRVYETRLRKVPEDWQRALLNWGYVCCDAALQARGARAIDAGLPFASTQS